MDLQLGGNLVSFQPDKTSYPEWDKTASLLRRTGNYGLSVIRYMLYVNRRNNNSRAVSQSKVSNNSDDLSRNANSL